MSEATATGYLKLDIKGFTEAIDGAKKALVAFTAVVGAVKIEEFFRAGIEKAIDFGAEMERLSIKTQLPVNTFLLLQRALQNGGLSASEAAANINKVVASGQSLAVLFQNPKQLSDALTTASAQLGSSADNLSANAEDFFRASTALSNLSARTGQFFSTVASAIVPALDVVLDDLEGVDLSGAANQLLDGGQKFAALLLGLFKNGTWGRALIIVLELGVVAWINAMAGAISYIGDLIARTLTSAASLFIGLFDKAFGTHYGSSAAGKEIKKDGLGGAIAPWDYHPKDLISTAKMEAQLTTLMAPAYQAGVAAISKDKKDHPIYKATPSEYIPGGGAGGETYKVIASSLAKIGGGGRSVHVGQSIQERIALQQLQAQQAANTVLRSIDKKTGTAKLGRG